MIVEHERLNNATITQTEMIENEPIIPADDEPQSKYLPSVAAIS